MAVELEGGRCAGGLVPPAGRLAGLYRYRASSRSTARRRPPAEQPGAGARSRSRGRPRVLLVERDPGQARHLAGGARASEGFEVDTTDASGLPADLPGLRPYAAVFLSDVPAYAMSPADPGGPREPTSATSAAGLVMLGGDESFGVGGWYRTPVERALPVRMDLTGQGPLPEDRDGARARQVLLDGRRRGSARSGWRRRPRSGRPSCSRTATRWALVTFDAASTWVSPLAPLAGPARAGADDVASIRSGGGTDIYPAVDAANKGLRATDAALKHIILLSDGMTTPGDFQKLIGGAQPAGPHHADRDRDRDRRRPAPR